MEDVFYRTIDKVDVIHGGWFSWRMSSMKALVFWPNGMDGTGVESLCEICRALVLSIYRVATVEIGGIGNNILQKMVKLVIFPCNFFIIFILHNILK